MYSKSTFRCLLIAGSVIGIGSAANAALIDPYYLLNGTGGEDSVQTLMTNYNTPPASNGFGGSVGQISSNAPGNILNYGDQTTNEVFVCDDLGAPHQWERLWALASLQDSHAIGYYTNLGGALAPGDITWVLWGGSNNLGLGTPGTPNWSAPVSGDVTNGVVFALAFSTGVPGETFYSQAWRNPSGVDFVATMKDFTVGNGPDSWTNGGLITSWEDKTDISFRDYNDFAVNLEGAHPVPEPASMATLALGAAALIRRRRQRATK